MLQQTQSTTIIDWGNETRSQTADQLSDSERGRESNINSSLCSVLFRTNIEYSTLQPFQYILLSSCITVCENQEPEPEMRQKLNLYMRLIPCTTAHFSSDSLLKVADPFWLEENSCTGQTLFNSSYIISLQLTSNRQTNLPAGRQTSNILLCVCVFAEWRIIKFPIYAFFLISLISIKAISHKWQHYCNFSTVKNVSLR